MSEQDTGAGTGPTADSPNPAAPTYDNNADAVIGEPEFEQNKNNAGTSESHVHEATQQQEQEAAAYDNAVAQQDEANAQPNEETE